MQGPRARSKPTLRKRQQGPKAWGAPGLWCAHTIRSVWCLGRQSVLAHHLTLIRELSLLVVHFLLVMHFCLFGLVQGRSKSQPLAATLPNAALVASRYGTPFPDTNLLPSRVQTDPVHAVPPSPPPLPAANTIWRRWRACAQEVQTSRGLEIGQQHPCGNRLPGCQRISQSFAARDWGALSLRPQASRPFPPAFRGSMCESVCLTHEQNMLIYSG